jgi:hypothetical protein
MLKRVPTRKHISPHVDNLRYQISMDRKCIVREVGGYDEETRNTSIILRRKPI